MFYIGSILLIFNYLYFYLYILYILYTFVDVKKLIDLEGLLKQRLQILAAKSDESLKSYIELVLLKAADEQIILTEKGIEELKKRNPR